MHKVKAIKGDNAIKECEREGASLYLNFIALEPDDNEGIKDMSRMATEIVREHFDPIIGTKQNDYMLEMFQTESAIKNQLDKGYNYYFVKADKKVVGFTAFYPRKDVMYLSKFYLYKDERGKGYASKMLEFIKDETKAANLEGIELNVNRENEVCHIYEHMGFKIIREEKNDIGSGFYMDDYVYRLDKSEFARIIY